MRTLAAMPHSRCPDDPSIQTQPEASADEGRTCCNRILAALDQAGDAIGVTDGKLRLVYCNSAFRAAFENRLPPPGSPETPLITQILGTDVARLRQEGRDRWTHETTVPARDGALRHVLARVSIIPGETTDLPGDLTGDLPGDPPGDPPGLMLIVSDITAERRTEALLQRRLTAMEATSDGIMITDPAGLITYVNPAQCRILGADPATLNATRWDFCLRPTGLAPAIYAVLATNKAGDQWRGEIHAERSTGTPLIAETTLTGLPDGGHVWIQRDATQKKRQDRERARMQRQSQQARKLQAIGRLAGGIAHDFNNLLASILGYAGFLKYDLSAGSREQGYARQIIAAGERGRDLVSRLLSVSRRPTGEQRPVDLSTLVREALMLTVSSMPETVIVRGPRNREPVYINGNETELVQAVMNLCLNARDALDESGGHISIDLRRRPTAAAHWPDSPEGGCRNHRIRIGDLADADQYAVVTVADTGIGIAPATLEEVVEPFYTTKPPGEGTGLGLATVNGIVATHGGTLTISSTPGTGTTVEMAFPAIAEQSLPATATDGQSGKITSVDANRPHGITAETPAEAEAETGEDAHRANRGDQTQLHKGKGVVLVVDDDDAIADLVSESLERLGIDAIGCADPNAALDAIRESPNVWRAILVDQNMPQKTGVELVAELRRSGIGVPAVLVSGNAPVVDRETLRTLGIANFVAKPIGTDDLRRLFGKGTDT